MKSHKENYLKINSYGNEKLCGQNSFLISNSPELSNNNLVLWTNDGIYIFKSNEEKEIEFKEFFNEEIIIQTKITIL